jgi:hypothetical protein
MTSTLQVHPAIAVLLAQIPALRDELARAVAYHDELRHTAIPYLEAVYQQALGPAQLAALEAQVAAQRAKRLVELARQSVNRGQSAPPLATITAQVEHELRAWLEHLAHQADGVRQATRVLSHTLTAADTAILKRVYRDLARRLHPDANPEQDDHARQLWLTAQEAYRDGDLARLQVCAEHIVATADLPTGTDALSVLQTQRERLQAAILALTTASVALEQRPPLSLRTQIADPSWIAERIAEFQAQQDSWREAATHWQAALAALYPTTHPDPSAN